MCVRASVRERRRDRWPRPALPEVNGSFAILFWRRKLGFGQKGTFISTMLILSAFRNRKHLLILEKKMGRAIGKFSLKGACCYLSSTSFLLKWSGPCEWLWSRQLPHFVSSIIRSRRKHGNSVSHQTIIHYSHVRDFQMTEVLKNISVFLLREGLEGHCSLLQPKSTQHFHFSILTNHFTHCHFFLPAHVIEKRHMETGMPSLQTFQHSFETNANQLFWNSPPPPTPPFC